MLGTENDTSGARDENPKTLFCTILPIMNISASFFHVKQGYFQIKSFIWWPEMARAGKNLVPLSEYVRSSQILQLTT